ncbi:toll/interleukin-1 receptor domain-containing protein [Thermoclostridium caenicola]|uniref:WD40 repeat n=1 Tax=Thermoclostridium caenicola TaxID=659425 RepID=A0A1M6KCF7_9FIRM|nr:TIR domain-containing protein [Thermoclostridium caenicola]SHJ56609.1 WD40 repeat [Thermoclostridium caenicola]
MQTYKYDAFISYRHTEPDKTIAEKLHRMLETYRVPKAVVKMGSQKKVGRVFRDREELPTSSNLAQSIQEALENSEHLIVICSPRTPASQWVCKEIETFAALHGHDRILPLLIEGEPAESFPEQLRFVKKQVVQEDGTVAEVVEEIEPLAADIRAEDLKGMKKKLKTEVLRLLAPILNCRFDDLKQRHRERRIKRILTLSFALSAFFLLFGSYSTYQAALIKQQAEVIKEKSEQVEQKSREVEEHARLLEIQVQKTLIGQSLYLSDIAQTYLAQGDRLGAVLVAREALPKNLANPERPYVEEAEYALSQALGVYKVTYGSELQAELMLRHDEPVRGFALSPDGRKAATVTDDVIHIWNAENGMLLNDYTIHKTIIVPLHFIDDRTLIFQASGGVHCLDVESMQEKWSYKIRSLSDLAISADNSKAALVYSDLIVLDTATGQPIMDIPLNSLLPGSSRVYGSHITFDESGRYIFFTIDDGRAVKVDLDRKEIERIYPAGHDYVIGLDVAPDGKVAVMSFNPDASNYYILNVFDASGNLLYSTSTSDVMGNPSFAPADSSKLVYEGDDELVILNIPDGSRHICNHGVIISDYYIVSDLIISATRDGNLRFWTIDGKEYDMEHRAMGMFIYDLDFVPGLVAFRSEKDVVFMRFFNNDNALLLEGHSDFIKDVIVPEDDRYVVSCSDYGEIILWDLEKAEPVATSHLGTRISKIHPVDNGNKFIILTNDERLLLYDSATLELIREENIQSVYSTVLSPDGSLCFLSGKQEDRIVKTADFEAVATLPKQFVWEALFFSDNSKMILNTSRGLALLDIAGQTIVKEVETGDLTGLRLSRDNSMLACISEKQSVKLYDTGSLEEKLTIEFTGPKPEAVFFDPSGTTLFISFSDHTIGRYNAADGKLVGMLDKKIENVKDIQFIQDRNIYIIVGLTESYIWHAETHKPIGHVRSLKAIKPKSGRLYVDFFEKLFVLPLYDTQGLLDEAERQLKGRALTPIEKQRLFIVE